MHFVRLQGGFGNNLFQVAFAYQLMHRLQHPVTLFRISHRKLIVKSPTWDFLQNHRDVESVIRAFGEFKNVSLNVISNRISEAMLTPGSKLRNVLSLRSLRSCSIHDPCWFPSDEEIKQYDVFSGYYQNAQSIKNLPEIFFENLVTILEALSEKSLLEMPYDFDACIQVRKGDFALHKESIGLLSNSFFMDSLECLGVKLSSAKVLVITDEPDACHGLIKMLPRSRIIGPSDAGSITALMLIAKSNKIVLSNSTLAWWGGFLGSRLGAKVAVPVPWRKQLCPIHGANALLNGVDFIRLRAKFDE